MLAEFFGVERKGPQASWQPPSEEQAARAMGELSAVMGPAGPISPRIKQMIEQVEELKRTHKGLIGNA